MDFRVFASGLMAGISRLHEPGPAAGHHIKPFAPDALREVKNLVIISVLFFEPRGAKNGHAKMLHIRLVF